MRTQAILFLFATISIFLACSSNEELTQTEELQILEDLLTDIQTLATSEPCLDSDEVSFSAIGSKACGGPTGFLAYSLNIDVDRFLSMVDDYTEKQRQFNMKWAVFSDCAVLGGPADAQCVNGIPQLIY